MHGSMLDELSERHNGLSLGTTPDIPEAFTGGHMNNPFTCCSHIGTPLGRITLARTRDGLAGVWFEGQRHAPAQLDCPTQPDDPLLREAARQLADYWAGRRRHFELPLDAQGTPFQRGVWSALLSIGAGQTTTYGAVARAVGAPRAVRAVGAAIGRNPLSIVVPCHRVIGSDGSLTGYAGGLPRKTALLRLETAHARAAA
jgi:methylated-DNA-[protein]-cysteine S-methyltransferase